MATCAYMLGAFPGAPALFVSIDANGKSTRVFVKAHVLLTQRHAKAPISQVSGLLEVAVSAAVHDFCKLHGVADVQNDRSVFERREKDGKHDPLVGVGFCLWIDTTEPLDFESGFRKRFIPMLDERLEQIGFSVGEALSTARLATRWLQAPKEVYSTPAVDRFAETGAAYQAAFSRQYVWIEECLFYAVADNRWAEEAHTEFLDLMWELTSCIRDYEVPSGDLITMWKAFDDQPYGACAFESRPFLAVTEFVNGLADQRSNEWLGVRWWGIFQSLHYFDCWSRAMKAGIVSDHNALMAVVW